MKVHLYWAVALLFAGCATYQSKISEPRTLLKAGQFAKSIELFGNLAKEESKDQLIYSLDYATALQISGDYSQSAKEFIKADKLISLNDFHSVSGLVGATLGGEEMVQYKGESFEKFLLNVINSLNYVMLGQVDEAVVEARIINDKINKMRMDGRDPYEPSPFARYLSGILWESQRNFDSAYIEYEAAYKLDPLNPFIQQDLLRISRLSHRTESLQKWKNQFGGQKEDPSSVSKENGELVVIFQQGWGPEKHPSKNYRFPQLVPQFSKTRAAVLNVNNSIFRSQIVYDISKVAIQTLQKDFGALTARRMGGVAAKAVVADQFRQKNELAGTLAWVLMNAADRADLRQWSTLPESIQLIRVFLKPGKYRFDLKGIDYSGQETETLQTQQNEIEIKSGQKTFLSWRAIK